MTVQMIQIPAKAVKLIAKRIYPDISERALATILAFSEVKAGVTVETVKAQIDRVAERYYNKLSPLEQSRVAEVVTLMKGMGGNSMKVEKCKHCNEYPAIWISDSTSRRGEACFTVRCACSSRRYTDKDCNSAISHWNHQNKTPELKPCPFCGSEDAPTPIDCGASWHINCSYCGSRNGSEANQLAAIEAWNRRVGDE